MNNDAIWCSAKNLWEYMLLGESVGLADCLIVLGSLDDRVARHAAELAKRFTYESIVVTGGVTHKNDLLATKWRDQTEAEHFANTMSAAGCRQQVLLEPRATNTGENATLSYKLLREHDRVPQSMLVVTKPYMERRARATFEKQWPTSTAHLHVTSPPISFDDYFNEDQPFDKIVAIMVGDMDRIIHYPQRGLQTSQTISEQAMQAFEVLKSAGYTQHLLK